MTHLTNLKVNY